MDCRMPGLPVPHHLSSSCSLHRSLPKFMFIALVMTSSHLTLWRPLLLPSIFSSIGDFSVSQLFASDDQNTGASASASVLSVSDQLISLKIDWFDLLAVQGTFRSLLQHHRSKTSILRRWFLGPDQKLLPGALGPIWPLSWRQRERWVAQDSQRLCCVISRR